MRFCKTEFWGKYLKVSFELKMNPKNVDFPDKNVHSRSTYSIKNGHVNVCMYVRAC